MTFEELCTTLRVTPEEQQALAEHLAALRAKATLKAFVPKPTPLTEDQIIDLWQDGGPDVMQWPAGRADVLAFVQRLDRARSAGVKEVGRG
jgi:hypothetical protein